MLLYLSNDAYKDSWIALQILRPRSKKRILNKPQTGKLLIENLDIKLFQETTRVQTREEI